MLAQFVSTDPCFISGDSSNNSQSCAVNAVLSEDLTSSAPLLSMSSVYFVINSSFLPRFDCIAMIVSVNFQASRMQLLKPFPGSEFYWSSVTRLWGLIYVRGGRGCAASPQSVILPWWCSNGNGAQYDISSSWIVVSSGIQRLADLKGSSRFLATLLTLSIRSALLRLASCCPNHEILSWNVQVSGLLGSGTSWTKIP
jgi:hypothetical protein